MEKDAGSFVVSSSKGVIPLMQTVFLTKDIVGVKDVDVVTARVFLESTVRHVDSFWLNGYYEIDFEYHGIEGKKLYRHRMRLPLKVEMPKWWDIPEGSNLKDEIILEIENAKLEVLAPYVLEFSGQIMVSNTGGKHDPDNLVDVMPEPKSSSSRSSKHKKHKKSAVPTMAKSNNQQQMQQEQRMVLPEIEQIQLETRNESYLDIEVRQPTSLEKDLVLRPDDKSEIVPAMTEPVPSHSQPKQEQAESKIDMDMIKAKALAKLQKDLQPGEGIIPIAPASNKIAKAQNHTQPDVSVAKEPQVAKVAKVAKVAQVAQEPIAPEVVGEAVPAHEAATSVAAEVLEAPMEVAAIELDEELPDTPLDAELSEEQLATGELDETDEADEQEDNPEEELLEDQAKAEDLDMEIPGIVRAKISMQLERPIPKLNTDSQEAQRGYRLRYYLVQNGDDLINIALKHNVSKEMLIAANKLVNEDVAAGAILNIPYA